MIGKVIEASHSLLNIKEEFKIVEVYNDGSDGIHAPEYLGESLETGFFWDIIETGKDKYVINDHYVSS